MADTRDGIAGAKADKLGDEAKIPDRASASEGDGGGGSPSGQGRGGRGGQDGGSAGDAGSFDPDGAWARVRAAMRRELDENHYRKWIDPLELSGRPGERVVLRAATRFARDWVDKTYGGPLLRYWKREEPTVQRLEVIYRKHRADLGAEAARGRGKAAARGDEPAEATLVELLRAGEAEQIALCGNEGRRLRHGGLDSCPLGPNQRFDRFVVGPSNEFAFALARQVAQRGGHPQHNPIYFYGEHGVGKTHLAQAIAWELTDRWPELKVAYLNSDAFTNGFTGSLQNGYGSLARFKQAFAELDVLLIDDFHRLRDRGRTVDEFLSVFNHLAGHGSQIVLCADRAPGELDGLATALRSRLNAALAVPVGVPCETLRRDILVNRQGDFDLALDAEILEFLALRIRRSVRELEGALARASALTRTVGRPLTREEVEVAVADLLDKGGRPVTIEQIQKTIASDFGIRVADLVSSRRSREIVRPRQIAIYLSKLLTPHSYPAIGRAFGKRDHSTAMYSCEKVIALMREDPEFAALVERLRRMLEE